MMQYARFPPTWGSPSRQMAKEKHMTRCTAGLQIRLKAIIISAAAGA